MSDQKVKPSFLLYLIPLVLLITGMSVSVFVGLNILNFQKNLERIVLPGKSTLNLQVGSYTVFYEYKSIVNQRSYSTGEDLPNLRYRLISVSDNYEVELIPSGVRSTTYSGATSEGTSIFQFNISKQGEYEYSSWYPNTQGGQDIVFAIGQKPALGNLLVAILSIFVSIFIGLILFIVIFIKRYKSKKEIKNI